MRIYHVNTANSEGEGESQRILNIEIISKCGNVKEINKSIWKKNIQNQLISFCYVLKSNRKITNVQVQLMIMSFYYIYVETIGK